MPIAVTLIQGVDVVDVASGTIRPKQDIELAAGRIMSVRPSGERTARPGQHALRGDELVAIPGLIDAHVHCLGVYLEDLSSPWDLRWFFKQMRQNLRAFLLSGVTTIRDMGAPTELIQRFARQGQSQAIVAPRMIVSGAMVCAPGGYPYFIEPLRPPLSWLTGQIRYDVSTPEQAQRAVDELARAGVHVVKAFWTSKQYDDRRSPLPMMKPEVLRAIHNRAARYGMPLAVHHTWCDDLDGLLALPFDSLEHLSIDRPMSDEQVARIVDRRLPVSTTLMSYGIMDHLDELEPLLASKDVPLQPRPRTIIRQAIERIRQGRVVTPHIGVQVMQTGSKHMLRSLTKLYQAGAKIFLGTDSGGAISPCGLVAWELEDMARAGMGPADILRTATINAAEVIRRPDLGKIEPGALADIVLLRRNPLQDISAVRDVHSVIKGGQLYDGSLNSKPPDFSSELKWRIRALYRSFAGHGAA